MIIEGKSMITKKVSTMNIPITEERYNDWCIRKREGTAGLIQDEFPELTPAQREFLISGITESEWNQFVVPEEDE